MGRGLNVLLVRNLDKIDLEQPLVGGRENMSLVSNERERARYVFRGVRAFRS